MSYILDALRRADAERERGAVPGIHAQQFGLLPGEEESRRPARALPWVAAGVTLLLLAVLAWRLGGRDAPATTAAPPTSIAAAPAVPVPPPAAVPASPAVAEVRPPAATNPPAAPAPAPAAAPATRVDTDPDARAPTTKAPTTRAATADRSNATATATAPAPATARGPIDTEPPVPKPARKVAAARAASASTGSDAASGAEPARRAADAEKPVIAQRDLPDAIRRELPAVTVSGSTYSGNRANRMLMVNGLIFHEGDTIANGLVLEQIRPRSAVLAFRGYRYELAF